MIPSTQLERLAKPFPSQYVKDPAAGKYGKYVDHEIVNQALLLILGPFSFRVEQVLYNPDGLVDGCTASLTAVVDGVEVTVTEAGDCEHAAQKKTQGERLKNAASDALKRCAMRLGCGIHLWAGNAGDFFLYETLRKRTAESAEAGEGPLRESTTGSPASAPSDALGAPRAPSQSASEPVGDPGPPPARSGAPAEPLLKARAKVS